MLDCTRSCHHLPRRLTLHARARKPGAAAARQGACGRSVFLTRAWSRYRTLRHRWPQLRGARWAVLAGIRMRRPDGARLGMIQTEGAGRSSGSARPNFAMTRILVAGMCCLMQPSRTGSRNCVNPSSLLNLVPPRACMPAGDLRCIAWRMCRRARARVHACWLALCVTCSYEETPESKKGPTAPALTDLWSVGAAEQPAAARQPGARRCCSLLVSLSGPRGDAKAFG